MHVTPKNISHARYLVDFCHVFQFGVKSSMRISLLTVFFHKKYIHSCQNSFYLLGYVNKFMNFCVIPLLIFKNSRYNFSQPFHSCRVCVNSGFPKF